MKFFCKTRVYSFPCHCTVFFLQITHKLLFTEISDRLLYKSHLCCIRWWLHLLGQHVRFIATVSVVFNQIKIICVDFSSSLFALMCGVNFTNLNQLSFSFRENKHRQIKLQRLQKVGI